MNEDRWDKVKAAVTQCQTRSEFIRRFKSLYLSCHESGRLAEVWVLLPKSKRRYASAYTDQELIDHARQYPNNRAWKEAGLALIAEGKPSPYNVAQKRGSTFFASCTAHMKRIPSTKGPKYYKYSDDEVLEKMRLCTTPVEFKRRFASHYSCALNRPHLRAKMDARRQWAEGRGHKGRTTARFWDPHDIID
jgi:hypothetical protein